MAEPHFRLEPLLKIREEVRDGKRRTLSVAEIARDGLAAELADVRRKIDAVTDDWRAALERPSPNPAELGRFRDYQDRLARRESALLKKMTDADGEIAGLRAEFDESVRDVRILEKLRDRKREEALQQRRKEEGNV